MKHHDKNRKFGRTSNQRKALIKSLMCSLIRDEKIVTTEAKAKELRPHIEKVITHGKKGGLEKKRFIISKIGNKKLAEKVVTEIAPRYQERAGGYTRTVKLPLRKSDASKMAQIELV